MMGLAAKMPGVISLAVGQPDYDTPKHIVDACKAALDAGHTRYGPALGIPELRQAVARKLWRVNGIQADPDTQVIITVGAQEAIMLAMLVLLDPGDEVIMPDPIYTNYHGHVPLVSAREVLVPAREENGFMMAAEDIEAAITDRTRVLLFNSPCNPTGAVASRAALESYASIAQKHDLVVISDEAYESLVYGDARHISIATLPGMAGRTVSVYTFSKSYAMTGWRVGYLTGPASIVDEAHKIQEEVVSCPVTFVQYGAVAALEGPQDCIAEMVAEYDRRRRFTVDALRRIDGVTCVEPQGAFYVFANVSAFGLSSQDLAMCLLEKAAVATVPGTAFGPGGEGFLRLCYGSASMASLEEGTERIRRGLNTIRRPGV
jgi:aspartate/methionine/tyrosine aminotransferase